MKTVRFVKKINLPNMGKLLNVTPVVKVDNDKVYEIKENELKINIEEGLHTFSFCLNMKSLFVAIPLNLTSEKAFEITKNQKIDVVIAKEGITTSISDDWDSDDAKLVYSADLLRSTIHVYEEYCEISGKTKTLNRAKGSKKLYYSDLTSVQFRKPTAVLAGYIQFEYPGSDSRAKSPYENENSVVFNKNDEIDLMESIYKYIDKRIGESRNARNASTQSTTVVHQAASAADELKKFKDLLDMGIITQEEFDAKKKQLLGL